MLFTVQNICALGRAQASQSTSFTAVPRLSKGTGSTKKGRGDVLPVVIVNGPHKVHKHTKVSNIAAPNAPHKSVAKPI